MSAVLCCVAASTPAALASLGSSDSVPAATLLLPYFEVDIGDADGDGFGDCNGVNTLFSVNNASAEPRLAHFTLWSDWSVATLDFDVFLTGYDVVTLNLCEVFTWGNLPITADEQNDPDDLISPHGGVFADNPSWDGSIAGCADFFPFEEGILQGFFLDRIQNAHAGYEVPGLGGCMGAGLNGAGQCSGGSCPVGTIARGYVTVDSVSECSLLFAGETGYFVDGGLGVVNNANVLWGDAFFVDPANDFAQGEPLVHIEANDDLNRTQVPLLDPDSGATVATVPNATGYTYYGRYTPLTGADNREPLGTVWATRYLNGGAFDATSWTVWRDSTQQVIDHVRTYACGASFGAGPDWFPMNETEVVCFDEAEDAVELCFITGGGDVSPPLPDRDPACFPLEAGRYEIGTEPLDPPFDFGWCYLNLNVPPDAPINDVDFGTSGNVGQSYVSARHGALGRFSVGLPAVQLHSALEDDDFANALTGAHDIPNP